MVALLLLSAPDPESQAMNHRLLGFGHHGCNFAVPSFNTFCLEFTRLGDSFECPLWSSRTKSHEGLGLPVVVSYAEKSSPGEVEEGCARKKT
jgi:hypothetical protein